MKTPKLEELLKSKSTIDSDDFNSIPDEKIISEILAGNKNLFKIIIRRYNQRLFRIVRSYISEEEDVKDVMQTTYLKAYKNLQQFRSEAKFSTWLIRIAINEALKLLKKKKKKSKIENVTCASEKDQINKSDTLDPEKNAIQSDVENYIEKAIDRLPLSYRKVFIMREIEQMNTKETAECLNISRANVKVRLHRAKKMLKEELIDMVANIEVFRFKGERCNTMTKSVMDEIKSRSLSN